MKREQLALLAATIFAGASGNGNHESRVQWAVENATAIYNACPPDQDVQEIVKKGKSVIAKSQPVVEEPVKDESAD